MKRKISRSSSRLGNGTPVMCVAAVGRTRGDWNAGDLQKPSKMHHKIQSRSEEPKSALFLGVYRVVLGLSTRLFSSYG